MDRLTVTGQPNPEIIGLTATDDPCSDICDQMDGDCDGGCPINEAYRRLAAYEDTGHTPEELAGLEHQNRVLRHALEICAGGHEGLWECSGPDDIIQNCIDEAAAALTGKEGE